MEDVSSKLCANILARRDAFTLTTSENSWMQEQANIDAPVWIPPFALRKTVRRVDVENIVNYADLSRFVRWTCEQPTIEFFDEILVQNLPYRDTSLFKAVSSGRKTRKQLGMARGLPVPLTQENFLAYYNKCIDHADFVMRNGIGPYQAPTDRSERRDTDIAVLIDAEGEIMFFKRGNHRVGIARALNIEQIPVKIYMLSGAYLERFLATSDVRPQRLATSIERACRAALDAINGQQTPYATNGQPAPSLAS